MFSLFKAPKDKILGMLPKHAVETAHAIEYFASSRLPDLNEVRRNHALAFVLGVWATNCAASGIFQLSQRDYDLMINLARISLKWLSEADKHRVIAIVTELADQDLMPRQPG